VRKGRREKAGNLREVQAIIFANANPAHSQKSQNRRSAAFRESPEPLTQPLPILGVLLLQWIFSLRLHYGCPPYDSAI
jgi:hypothetical protein